MSEEPPDTPYVKAKKRFVVKALAFFGMFVAAWIYFNNSRQQAIRDRQPREAARPKE